MNPIKTQLGGVFYVLKIKLLQIGNENIILILILL